MRIIDKFSRGTVVRHKVMGKGVVLNKLDDGMVEVRMENGQREKFYPEELETEGEVQARWDEEAERVNQVNKNRLDPYN